MGYLVNFKQISRSAFMLQDDFYNFSFYFYKEKCGMTHFYIDRVNKTGPSRQIFQVSAAEWNIGQ